MPFHNRYRLRPTQKEIDAYLEVLEQELSQHRVSTAARQAPVPIEAHRSDPHSLLWFLLMIGIGFFVWLLSMISY